MGHTLDPTLIPIWIRFIPTHVGHTIPSGIGIPPHPVHPHIRGAYASSSRFLCRSHGSSPHTWGIRRRSHTHRFGSAVHPHIRGAYAVMRLPSSLPDGSSPHTWGIRLHVVAAPDFYGSSPHTWGILRGRGNAAVGRLVHPHIRGAYRGFSFMVYRPFGSSPHTWGIPDKSPTACRVWRFIPTYVGHTISKAAARG